MKNSITVFTSLQIAEKFVSVITNKNILDTELYKEAVCFWQFCTLRGLDACLFPDSLIDFLRDHTEMNRLKECVTNAYIKYQLTGDEEEWDVYSKLYGEQVKVVYSRFN